MAQKRLQFDLLRPKPEAPTAKAIKTAFILPPAHFCHCGAWGSFGYGKLSDPTASIVWRCGAHRIEDEDHGK
jgi:hypothetical protein